MTIYNKDGTPFRLKGPNPLMKEQEITNDWHLVHNFRANEEIVNYRPGKKPTKKVIKAPEPEPEPPKVEPVVEVKPEPMPVIEEPEVEVEDEVTPPEPVKEEPRGSMCWCLPATVKQYIDPLYGETKVKLAYGDKFKIEVVPVQVGDINYSVWTTAMVPTNSILYMPQDRRWWRVLKTTLQDNGGFIVTCMPSTEKPSFD